ncbi:11788_t:CDS:2 [Cetraspora pellucida]|uniref:11788_t:CDS:1 n=1 Tax=Cetraspora pellucida TaxID=1433469 RepID=A0ACA9M5L5_9GLOM|nr:11788_t:CDS:2 [Cetraspora pellucida]
MDNYEPLEIIGTGSFGLIRKVRRKSDSRILARKEIDYRRMNDKERNQLVSEVNILRELKHPNIVRYYDRYIDNTNCMIYIIMEYCEGGDLSSIIKKCRKEGNYLSESTIWFFFTQILQALHECHYGYGNSKCDSDHSQQHITILHRDIKPENVLLGSDNKLKLGDFGLSRKLNLDRELAQTYVGTPYYMSPELITESHYDTKSDIWSLGCLLYELCALQPPFQAKSQPSLAIKISAGMIPPLPSRYSEELNNIIRATLMVDPNKRPTTMELLKMMHPSRDITRREEELKQREIALNGREMMVTNKEEELRRRFAELQQCKQQLDFERQQFANEAKLHTEQFNMEVQRQKEEFKAEYANILQQKEELNNGFLELKRQKDLQAQILQTQESELKRRHDDLQHQIDEFNKTRDTALLEQRTIVSLQTQVSCIKEQPLINENKCDKINDTLQVIAQVETITNNEVTSLYNPSEDQENIDLSSSEINSNKKSETFAQKVVCTQKKVASSSNCGMVVKAPVLQQELPKTRLRKLIYPPLEARPRNITSISSIIPQKRLQQKRR